jgi:hypothetical protein
MFMVGVSLFFIVDDSVWMRHCRGGMLFKISYKTLIQLRDLR